MIRPPSARLGPVTPDERKTVMANSPVMGKYEQTVDPQSAYEVLSKRVAGSGLAPAPGQAPAPEPQAAPAGGGMLSQIGGMIGSIFGTNNPRGQRLSTTQIVARTVVRSVGSEVARSVAKSVGGGLSGRVTGQIIRGTLGGVLRR
jgi:hypothetical protein